MNAPSPDSARKDAQSRVAWQAATLDERRAHGVRDADAVAEGIDALLERWRQACAAGDPERYARRLAWDGWDLPSIAAVLGPGSYPAPPAWQVELDAALEALRREGLETLLLPARIRRLHWPFPEAWWPWAMRLTRALRSLPGAERLDASAWSDLDLLCVEELAQAGAEALYRSFQQHPGTPEHSTLYRRFLRTLAQGHWSKLFQEYPGLARQIGTRLIDLRAAWTELLAALTEDAEGLARCFGLDAAWVVHAIEPLGDRHGGARRVLKLELGGRAVVYKPRDARLELALGQLIEAMNAAGLDPPLPVLRGFGDRRRGWFEYVDATPARDSDHARRCFRQLGALTALAYLGRASDLHMENVVVGPDGPLIIDAETFLQPVRTPVADRGAMQRAAAELEDSCLASGMVRFLGEAADGRRFDESVLRGLGGRRRRWGWAGLGTDELHPSEIELPPPAAKHRVRLDGQVLAPEPYLAELCAGFAAAHRTLGRLHTQNHPVLEGFRSGRTRVVLRPSRQYAGLLEALAGAKAQRSGVHAFLLLETLRRPLLAATERPSVWPLLDAEAAALLRGDLPQFHVRLDDTALECGAASVAAEYDRSPYQAFRARLDAADEDDLQRQLQWLRAALTPSAEAEPPAMDAALEALPPAEPLPAHALRSLVLDLAEQLIAAAISGADDALTWIAPSHLQNPAGDRGVSHYLYDGSLGIAWFLAAAGRVLEKPHLQQAARRALAPIRRFLRDPAAPLLVAKERFGIAHGLGSLVAGLCALAGELNDRQLVEDAERAAGLLMRRKLSGDEPVDLEGGIAGALLALVRLIQISEQRSWLMVARPYARALLERRGSWPEGRGWVGYNGLPLAGFMHGQSGIAYALSEFAGISAEPDVRAAVAEAWELEDGWFDAERAAWPLRLPAGGGAVRLEWMSGWCNGRAGILLARLAAGRRPAGAERDRLERAALALYGSAPRGVDHLCCGILGNALALAELGRTLHRPEALEQARRWLAAVVHAAAARGAFRLRVDDEENRAFQPGLFRGLAGIGYAALALAWPDRVSQILRFEVRRP